MPELRAWLHAGAPVGAGGVAVLGGGKPALTLAAFLAGRGSPVTVLEPTAVFGLELGLPGRFRLVADLEAAGVRLAGSAQVRSIGDGVVSATIAGVDEQIKADAVVVTTGAHTDTTMVDALAAAGVRARPVGDCREVRQIEGANLDAAALALALG